MAMTEPAPFDEGDAYKAAVDGMTEAAMVHHWGTEYDPERFGPDAPGEAVWREAREGHASGASDDFAYALDWLIANPLAFLDAYADMRRF